MDTRTGEIKELEDMKKTIQCRKFLVEVDEADMTPKQVATSQVNFRDNRSPIGKQLHTHRNSACPCGSGKKLKKCCG